MAVLLLEESRVSARPGWVGENEGARLRPIGPFFERDEQALKEHSHAHVLSEINQTPTLMKDDYRGGLCNKTFRRKSTYTVESTTAPSNVLRMRPGPKQVRFTIPFVKPYAA